MNRIDELINMVKAEDGFDIQSVDHCLIGIYLKSKGLGYTLNQPTFALELFRQGFGLTQVQAGWMSLMTIPEDDERQELNKLYISRCASKSDVIEMLTRFKTNRRVDWRGKEIEHDSTKQKE
jgi:hypothetical protein